MELGNLAQWVALAVSIATVVFQTVSLRTKASAEKLGDLERRLTGLEGEVRHLPSRDSTHKMEIQLEKMNGQLLIMAERLAPMAATSERLQEFLLDEAKATRGRA